MNVGACRPFCRTFAVSCEFAWARLFCVSAYMHVCATRTRTCVRVRVCMCARVWFVFAMAGSAMEHVVHGGRYAYHRGQCGRRLAGSQMKRNRVASWPMEDTTWPGLLSIGLLPGLFETKRAS